MIFNDFLGVFFQIIVSIENRTVFYKLNNKCLCSVGPGCTLPAFHASGRMQLSGAILAQNTLWERNGGKLIGEVLLPFASSVSLPLLPELCHNLALFQPHFCWSQTWSPLSHLTSEGSSCKVVLVRREKLLRIRKILLKNTDSFLKVVDCLGDSSALPEGQATPTPFLREVRSCCS